MMQLKDHELADYNKLKLIIKAASMYTNGRISMRVMGSDPECTVIIAATILEKLLREADAKSDQ